MTARRVLLALTVVGGSLAFTSSAAFAGGPSVPPGCSFSQGVLTCVTSSTTASQLGPETTNAQWLPASTVFDGIPGSQICTAAFGSLIAGSPTSIEMVGDTYLDVSVTVTTTTQQRGYHGPVFGTSTSSSTTLTSVEAGSLSCSFA